MGLPRAGVAFSQDPSCEVETGARIYHATLHNKIPKLGTLISQTWYV